MDTGKETRKRIAVFSLTSKHYVKTEMVREYQTQIFIDHSDAQVQPIFMDFDKNKIISYIIPVSVEAILHNFRTYNCNIAMT